MARAKGLPRGQTKGSAAKNDQTKISQQRRVQSPKILSSEAANNVGRPGFGGKVPGPVDGKSSVKVLRAVDPAKGETLPAANKITTTHVDLVGTQNPKILGGTSQTASNSGKRVVRPPRQSQPVRSSKPGRVTRPGSR